jgi:ubiquinone/menaquinone biosynthesis C-methylase UbiE
MSMISATSPPTTDQVRAAWDALASRYDQFVTDEDMPFAEAALIGVDVGYGTRLLDVGCGTGAVSIPAARRGARVTAVDLAPAMIQRLLARAQAEELSNLEGLVMDAHALDLPDDAFDVSASQNGVSLLPDVDSGLREIVRVTKPGGRVLIIAFGAPQRAEFLGFFMGALQAVVPDIPLPPMDPPPLPMQLADPSRFRGKLVDAGLTEVRVETTSWDMHFASGSHFWNVVTSSNPIAVQLIGDLTGEQRSEVQQVLAGMLRERSGGGPDAVLHNDINIGTGTK